MGLFDFFSSASSTGRNVSGRRIVKSAMTSMLWICSIASTTCFSAAYAFKDKEGLCIFFAIVGSIPFFVACFMFIYFGMKDPDRLHSEEYRLRDRVLRLTETKGGRIPVNPVELTDIANPFPDAKTLEYKQAAIESESEEESEEDNNG